MPLTSSNTPAGRLFPMTDDDFRISHLLGGRPARLLHTTCGNISTPDLLGIYRTYLDVVFDSFTQYTYVELDRDGVTIHEAS